MQLHSFGSCCCAHSVAAERGMQTLQSADFGRHKSLQIAVNTAKTLQCISSCMTACKLSRLMLLMQLQASTHILCTRKLMVVLLAAVGQQAVPVAQRQLACSMFLQEDTPVLHVVESCPIPGHGGIALRKYAIHSVDSDAAPPQPPPKSGKYASDERLALQ